MEERQSHALLGQLLLASETITPEELREALYRQGSTGEPLGQILVDMEALAPRQLERVMHAQARLRGKPDRERPFILVVDDDPEVGAVVGDILEGGGYRVGVAQTEAEAVAAVLASDGISPELIVLDLGLPDHGGLELLTILRKNGSTRELPVVILTGQADMEPKIRSSGLEISEFLVKPVPARQLIEVVDKALREAKRVAVPSAG